LSVPDTVEPMWMERMASTPVAARARVRVRELAGTRERGRHLRRARLEAGVELVGRDVDAFAKRLAVDDDAEGDDLDAVAVAQLVG